MSPSSIRSIITAAFFLACPSQALTQTIYVLLAGDTGNKNGGMSMARDIGNMDTTMQLAGVPQQNIVQLVGPNFNRNAIVNGVTNLARACGGNDTLVLYFSCHGGTVLGNQQSFWSRHFLSLPGQDW